MAPKSGKQAAQSTSAQVQQTAQQVTQKAQQATQAASAQVQQTAQQASQKVQQVTQAASAQAQQATQQAKQQVQQATKQVSQKARQTPAETSNALGSLWNAYVDGTPARLKFVDSFLVFLMLSGMIQFAYCVLVTNFPFNAFLAGFASNVGQFVLTASLRAQVNPENRGDFKEVSPERAFSDFVIGSIVLHFFVFNFLG